MPPAMFKFARQVRVADWRTGGTVEERALIVSPCRKRERIINIRRAVLGRDILLRVLIICRDLAKSQPYEYLNPARRHL